MLVVSTTALARIDTAVEELRDNLLMRTGPKGTEVRVGPVATS